MSIGLVKVHKSDSPKYSTSAPLEATVGYCVYSGKKLKTGKWRKERRVSEILGR